MPNPRLVVNLAAIAANAAEVVRRGHERGLAIAGVTKACCGSPAVADAMLQGGVAMLADSRLANLARLRRHGLTKVPLLLLRLPMLSQAREAARLADAVLVSEIEAIRRLARQAGRRPVRAVIMVDLGDLREGLWPDQVAKAAEEAAAVPGCDLLGLGANLTCYGGVRPTPANLAELVALAEAARRATGKALPLVSGGNTSSLPLLWDRTLPDGVTHLRVGEGILLGVETLTRQPLPGLRQDAFSLVAEVIEAQRKPSKPVGDVCQDAFGRTPRFEDRGWERRLILAIGRQDCVPEGLQPLRDGLTVLGGSSDHLIVADRAGLSLGEEVGFRPSYGALLAAMTSPYVTKEYIG